ncbi:hypothetical protein [Ideonella sp.]|uniref:hypothetical protein n=1 Tax=Ideonella sp. TaxID=1929293 RepID=UPI0035B4997E
MTRPPRPDADPAGSADDDDALERLLRASRQLEDPPAWAVDRVLDLAQGRSTRPATGAAPWWRRVLAELRVDSGGGAGLALGLRGAAREQRQWLFAAGDHDVDLRLTRPGAGGDAPWELAGQVLGPQAPRTVRLRRAEDGHSAEYTATVGELGDFRLPALPDGRWTVAIDFDDWTIELPELAWPMSP